MQEKQYFPNLEAISSVTTLFLHKKFISRDKMKALDEELMSPSVGFSLEQLMELAGKAVAQCIFAEYKGTSKRILTICGPGSIILNR